MEMTTSNVSSSIFMDVDTDVRSLAMLYTAYKIGQSHNTPQGSEFRTVFGHISQFSLARNNSYYFSRANQQKAGTKIYSLTQCSLIVNECDWHILAGKDERINSHCLTRVLQWWVYLCFEIYFLTDHHCKIQSKFFLSPQKGQKLLSFLWHGDARYQYKLSYTIIFSSPVSNLTTQWESFFVRDTGSS